MVVLTELDGWLIALGLIGIYGAILFVLHRQGRLGPDRALSLYGPALMMKTRRGRGLLDRIGSYRRFWTVAGSIGVALAGIAMIVIVALLALEAVLATQIPASAAPSPSEALALPGINPIIPVGYGIAALVVGIVLHELAHGIVARSQKIGVKSIGILWFVVPIGAFVEQDDEEMGKAPRRARRRVAAAGVLANFVLAVVFFALLSAVVASSVAVNANGVGIAYVVPNSPAANASLASGDIITSVNGTTVTTNTALLNTLANTTAGQSIPLTYYSESRSTLVSTSITLASRASYTGDASQKKEGFLGVATVFLTPGELRSVLVFPPTSPNGAIVGGVEWIVLPLAGLEPIASPTSSYFHLTGPLAAVGPGTFWIGANLLYWLAWINLLLGLSNALPLVPLDGGLLFREFVGGIATRLRPTWSAERLNAFAGTAAAVSSVAVIFLLLWQFVAPQL